jgi:Zn-dependent M28 family amino/carboxypeptidase
MKFYTYETAQPVDGLRAGTPPLAPGTSWVQFGRETLYYTDAAPDDRGAAPAGRGARPRSSDQDVAREQLHVVVQNGRTFQVEHPEVPIIHDRGRFLLVNLDPGKARELMEEAETCYAVTPLEENQVVFDVRAAPAARPAVPSVQDLVNKATRGSFEANVQQLVSFGTRHSNSDGYVKATTFARDKLDAMNYQTRLQTVALNNKPTHNVIADKSGHGGETREVVIVTAHLDSINLQGGPAAPAPGADDNGSGSAGVLEIARVFHDQQGIHDLRLILFGGEEEGLFGSKYYVATLDTAEKARIRAVVNMDMIASLNNPTRTVLLEGAPVSQTIIDSLSEAASTYTGLTVETSLYPAASDHVPFIKADLPAVLTIEGADNTNGNIHSAEDTLQRLDYDFGLEILRMNIAFIADELGIQQ